MNQGNSHVKRKLGMALALGLTACSGKPAISPVEPKAAHGFADSAISSSAQAYAAPSPSKINSTAVAGGVFGFRPYVYYPLGDWLNSTNGQPDTIAIGDVTGDGNNDVVMVTLGNVVFPLPIDHRVFIYERHPLGGLKPPRAFPYSDGLYERANNFINTGIVLVDLNGDRTDDIVVGYGKGINVMLSSPAGGFETRKFLIAPEFRNLDPVFDSYFVQEVVALDINRDGNQDIVAFHTKGAATAFFGDGKGGVSEIRPILREVTALSDAKAGDFDGDGYKDLVVLSGHRYTRTFWLIRNNGERDMGTAVAQRLVDDETYASVAMGDWNGDNHADIAISVMKNQSQYGLPAGLLIFEQAATGQLNPPYSLNTLDLPLSMISTDLNGDRRDDLLVEHHGWENLGYLVQDAGSLSVGGLIGTPLYSSAGFSGQAMAAGDLNGDGCKDLAFADLNYGLVTMEAENCMQFIPTMSSPLPPRLAPHTP